jgi:hypothetical protein
MAKIELLKSMLIILYNHEDTQPDSASVQNNYCSTKAPGVRDFQSKAYEQKIVVS